MKKNTQARIERDIDQNVTTHEARRALTAYKLYVLRGGKRPFIHAVGGRIIAPMHFDIVPFIEPLIGADFLGDTLKPDNEREYLRSLRRERHDKNIAAKAPKLASIKLSDDAVDEINEDVGEEHANHPIIWKAMKGGYVTALLVYDNSVRQADAFRVIGDTAIQVSNPVKHRPVEDLLEKGWAHATAEKFPGITLCVARQVADQVERRINSQAAA